MAENKYGVELISGITPKNNCAFPLVHAKDVEMPDGTRLSNLTIPEQTKCDLPTVTASDNGKILQVKNGKWEAAEISDHSVKTVNGIAPDQNGNVALTLEPDMEAIKDYIDEYISSALGGDY
jgi:hypothetical protein